jgi:hypothetical protein
MTGAKRVWASAPTVVSAPSINGSGTVGVALSYTPGSYTGNPTPTVTRQWLLDGSAISGATGATYTPVSGDIGTNRLTVRETATNTAGSVQSTSSAVSIAAGGGGASVASFSLTTTAATGTYPFYLAHPFRKGQVPASVTCAGLVDYRVVVLRTWNDGSAKHVLIVGRAALTQNVPLSVAMSTGTPPSGGTNLAQTDIPTGTYSIGVSGATLTFNPRTDTPYYSKQTPVMSEFWFRQIDATTKQMGCMGVRVYIDGRVQCKPFIANGRLDNGSGAKDTTIAERVFVPTFVVNGTTVFNNGGVNATLRVGARIMGDNTQDGWYWTNGTNPSITPTFDVDYILSTQLVPMYGYGDPDNATLAALIQNYVLGSNGPIEPDMSSTGAQFQIGPLTDADAKYLTSGDARAYRAVLCASSSLNSYNIANGLTADGNVLKLSTFGTWTQDGPNQGGSNGAPNSAYNWDVAHHGSGGYLAYMLTGDRWHYETMALNMATAYLCVHSAAGSGVNRLLTGTDASANQQIRGFAWLMRTLGQFAAIAPDAELAGGQIAAEYRTLLVNNYNALLTRVHDLTPPRALGILHIREHGLWITAGDIPMWQLWWVAIANAMNSENDCVPDANYQTVERVRDFSYGPAVGLLGGSGLSHDHDFTLGANYGHKVANDNSGNGFAKNWGDVHLKNYGSLNTTATNTLQGTGNSTPTNLTGDSYWAILSCAISYAAQHRAEGALTAYRRLHGATNWVTGEATLVNNPKWGIKPRALPAVAYTLPSTVNTSVLVGLNTARSIKPAGWTDGQFDLSTFHPYGGGVFVPWYGDAGAWILANPGGHNNQGLLGCIGFDIATRMWFLLPNANGVPLNSTPVWPAEANAAPWYEMLSATIGEMPVPGHIYASHVALRRGKKGVVISPTRGAMFNGPDGGNFSSPSAHQVDLDTGLFTRACASANASSTIHVEGSSAYDPVDGRIYFTDSAFWTRQFISYIRLSDMTFQTLALTGWPPSGTPGTYTKMAIIPERRVLIFVDGAGLMFGTDLTQSPATIVQLTPGGPGFANNNGANTWVWNRRKGKLYQKGSSTGNVLNTITPPQTNAYGTGGTWDRGSVTIGGSGLPNRTETQEHYTCLFDSEVTDCLGWIAGTTQQVALALI